MTMTKIRISLLPVEMKRQSSMMRVWTVIAVVLVVIAIALLISNLLMARAIKGPVDELEHLKTEQQHTIENIGRLSYIKEMFDEIQANNVEINNLRGIDPEWVDSMILSATDVGLYGIRVKRMALSTGSEKPNCVLTCWTDDVDNIRLWIDFIEGLEGIESVRTTDITTNVLSENTLEFQFNAVLGLSQWNAE